MENTNRTVIEPAVSLRYLRTWATTNTTTITTSTITPAVQQFMSVAHERSGVLNESAGSFTGHISCRLQMSSLQSSVHPQTPREQQNCFNRNFQSQYPPPNLNPPIP
ncbi:uncharacterized protein ACRADG_003314 isoform 1-T1 [Cochliomyia hominivorax]